MASADFSQQALLRLSDFFPYRTSVRPPRVRAITFPSSVCHIYMLGFGQYGTLLCAASSSVLPCLICDFCSSDRGFASGFLQIPPRDGHPCLWLTVPTAKPVADFHRRVITHAGRTTAKPVADFHRRVITHAGRTANKACPASLRPVRHALLVHHIFYGL